MRADGQVEPFLEELSGRFTEAEIAETKTGHTVVLREEAKPAENRNYRSVGLLFGGRITGERGKKKLAVGANLEIRLTPSGNSHLVAGREVGQARPCGAGRG